MRSAAAHRKEPEMERKSGAANQPAEKVQVRKGRGWWVVCQVVRSRAVERGQNCRWQYRAQVAAAVGVQVRAAAE